MVNYQELVLNCACKQFEIFINKCLPPTCSEVKINFSVDHTLTSNSVGWYNSISWLIVANKQLLVQSLRGM